MKRINFKRFLNYFFSGLLFVVPLAATVYILTGAIRWIDGLIELDYPGIGLLIIISVVTFLGFMASTFITKPFFEFLEKALEKVPLFNLIYTSLKDLIGAFVGDKKKFNKPVLVELNENLFRLGFVTQEDLTALGIDGMVCVYLPHSYNFSGNHFIVPANKVKPVNVNSTSAMKFIVSGGVSGI